MDESLLTDGRGILKDTKVLIDNEICIYLGFNESQKLHYFKDNKDLYKTLPSLKECFKANIKYQNSLKIRPKKA